LAKFLDRRPRRGVIALRDVVARVEIGRDQSGQDGDWPVESGKAIEHALIHRAGRRVFGKRYDRQH
jgi:hypothetical protein